MWDNRDSLKAVVLIGLAVTTAMQAAARAEVAPCNPSTVAYWRFDGDYTDSCGSIDGTPVGSASIATSNCAPLSGNSGCLVLTGSPSRVDLPAPFNPTHTGTLSAGTIEAWVYFEGTDQGDCCACIFDHGVAAISTDLQLEVRPHTGGGYDSQLDAANIAYPVFLLPGFTPNTWHHLAWTWDATTVTSYMDGVVVGTAAGPLSVSFTGNEAAIGSGNQELSYWVGRLDEIRLSNRVLAPCEFLAHLPTCPTLSEWGLIAMAALMLLAGGVVIARRRAGQGITSYE